MIFGGTIELSGGEIALILCVLAAIVLAMTAPIAALVTAWSVVRARGRGDRLGWSAVAIYVLAVLAQIAAVITYVNVSG